jgi:3-oxoisoapionate decarboxylase
MPVDAVQKIDSSTGPALRTSLGVVTYCFDIAKKASAELPGLPNLTRPLIFLEECWGVGAGGAQLSFGILPHDEIKAIRAFKEKTGMHLESTVDSRLSVTDPARLEAEFTTLQALGINIARTVLFAGRRYEQFKSLPEFKAALEAARQTLRRVEPMARRFGIRLAIENHKDQRTEERLQLLSEFSSEWIGACFDVGNNLALLENPIATAEAFAPWTLTVHFKDQGLREYDEGFLLADVPLGAGAIDLPKIISIVSAKRPAARFHLELITRDALRVPTLSDSYWGTLADLPARVLASHLEFLKGHKAGQPFPVISGLPLRERVAAERANIEQSFAFASANLGFAV